jgi:hypothetical protein
LAITAEGVHTKREPFYFLLGLKELKGNHAREDQAPFVMIVIKDFNIQNKLGYPVKFSGATLGFQQIITGEVNLSLGARDSKLHIERKGPYRRIVQCAARAPVVFYGSCEKIAWLVPSSAVILHIAKTLHYGNPYTNADGKQIIFPSADPSMNNHQAAEKMLLEQAASKLSSKEILGTKTITCETLSRIFGRTWKACWIKKLQKKQLQIQSFEEQRGVNFEAGNSWT